MLRSVLICIQGVCVCGGVTLLHICQGPPPPDAPLLSRKYYMSARHMALAKAFPEHFTYEPHEADTVSWPGSL